MEYYILNNDLEVLMGVELFQSMIWTEKFWDIGDFELYLPATNETFKIYTEAAKNRNYIIQAKDAKLSNINSIPIMVIDSVKLDDTFESGDYLIIKGKQAKAILSQRIVWGTKTVSGNIQDVLRDLVIENAIAPTESDRAIPNMILGDLIDIPVNDDYTVNADVTGASLSDAIIKLCKDRKVGWDVVYDFEKKKLKFVMLHGNDHSRGNPNNTSWVTFSADFDNIIKSSYRIDNDNYKNIAMVAATYEEYDKNSRTVKIIDSNQIVAPYKLQEKPRGLNRYELYVKGDSPSIKDITDEINVAALDSNNETKGRTELNKYKNKIEVSAEVAADITYKYGRDYFVGDLVTIQNEYGVRYDARITSVTTTLTTSKNQTIPTFTIENYTGKEEDDTEKDTEDIRRVDENGVYRDSEDGIIRTVGTGLKFYPLDTENVTYLKNGTTTTSGERVTETDQTREVIAGYYDPSKYKIT